MKIKFHPEAEFELCEAREWYARQRSGLDAEFMRCIDETVARIRRYPEMFPFAMRNARKTMVKRFPYTVYYETGDDEIMVLAVFHASRNPEHWQRRT
ncbi:MAG: type II toxin-antitoxin system RelE/ParE family toxin [Desulfobacterales bacterium]|nr:type II toxin-antitoxin system RelE/ParE family toxin [Desulfobacterales bacterium]